MSLDMEPLVAAIIKLVDKIGRGSKAEIGRRSQLDPVTIGKIYRREVVPRPETWEKLHKAFSDDIPRPPWLEQLRKPPEDEAEQDLLTGTHYFIHLYKDIFTRLIKKDPGEVKRLSELCGMDFSADLKEGITFLPAHAIREKLHQARDDLFPPADYLKRHIQIPLIPHATPSEQAEIITDVWQIPVFDAGAGMPSSFSDSGYPVGEASEFVVVPRQGLDENSFAVTVHGDSMTPTLDIGDKCVVVPSAPLINGKLCFVTWSNDEFGDRLIKRYRKSENAVILESDNRKYDPIILTDANGEGVRIFRVTQIIKDV